MNYSLTLVNYKPELPHVLVYENWGTIESNFIIKDFAGGKKLLIDMLQSEYHVAASYCYDDYIDIVIYKLDRMVSPYVVMKYDIVIYRYDIGDEVYAAHSHVLSAMVDDRKPLKEILNLVEFMML